MDEILGLPAHPLLVHVPVVLTPLAALGALALALQPRWRRGFGWIPVGLAAVALAATHFAIESGHALQDAVKETRLIEQHKEAADLARPAEHLGRREWATGWPVARIGPDVSPGPI